MLVRRRPVQQAKDIVYGGGEHRGRVDSVEKLGSTGMVEILYFEPELGLRETVTTARDAPIE